MLSHVLSLSRARNVFAGSSLVWSYNPYLTSIATGGLVGLSRLQYLDLRNNAITGVVDWSGLTGLTYVLAVQAVEASCIDGLAWPALQVEAIVACGVRNNAGALQCAHQSDPVHDPFCDLEGVNRYLNADSNRMTDLSPTLSSLVSLRCGKPNAALAICSLDSCVVDYLFVVYRGPTGQATQWRPYSNECCAGSNTSCCT